MRIGIIALCLVWAGVSGYAATDLTVALPPGETSLLDLGMYRVGYQSYGGQEVWMPDSWVGHFEPVAGISYQPGQTVLGRPALLLHSPWHVNPGKMWVDYRLKLPQITPLRLGFGITMGPGMMAPKMSDGVTFSAYVNGKELMNEFYPHEGWKDFDFDLTPYAGQTITLRLQVEPGPANSPSFDYSYFGAPRIMAGAETEARAALVAQLMNSKAYLATATADMRGLSNDSSHGVTPSNLLAGKNELLATGGRYDFTYTGKDCTIAYHYEPKTGTLADVTCSIDGGQPMLPADGGGVFAERQIEGRTERVLLAGGKAVSVKAPIGGSELLVRWEYPIANGTVAVDWTFGIVGKALTVRAKCDAPVLVGLSLGRVSQASMRRMLPVPYLPSNGMPLCYLPAEKAYVCRYLDWTASHASSCPQGESNYENKTDGSRNALYESGYVAVSPNVDEVLPNIPWPASPYLSLLGPRIMLDVWGHHKGTFAGSAENLRDLKDNGVDHLAIINHVWQRWGYDVKLPDHVPANPGLGGDEGMIAFGKAANDSGYVWSCHENYIDLYPDAPSYDPTAAVLKADGSKALAWYNPGTKVQSFGLKCNRAKGFAEQNSPYIHKTYGTNAAYLDVHTCVPPWHELDHQADQPMAAMALAKVKYDGELFQYMRDTHQGPLFGEGNNQFYWAGKCDGVEAQVNGGEDHTPFLDLDLLKMHPQMVNHGMGYYERWFMTMRDSKWGKNAGTVEQIDKYRAQTLAYGHAGFIGSNATDNIQWVAKEHNLMHPVTALYGTAKPTRVAYEIDGKLVGASVALAVGDTSRQVIEYDSGLKLFVNWNAQPWKVGDKVLPQWGYLATAPGMQSYTGLKDGKYLDYAECPEYLFADARTSFNMPYAKPGKNIEPKLGAFEYLGGNKIRLTYDWVVGDKLDEDYHCFVHFTNKSNEETDSIIFQQDHTLPKPTTQWNKGETVVDGPYEITIPDDKLTSYDITIGLFANGPRVPMKGLDDGSVRIVLGRLVVTRQDGKVTDVKLADMAEVAKSYVEEGPRLDFGSRLNEAGTMIDFGKIATDGSVKVERTAKGLILFPFPRDKQFTVSLDLKGVSPQAKIVPASVKVRILAARTQADMGAAPVEWVNDRLVVKVGQPGAGRYVISW